MIEIVVIAGVMMALNKKTNQTSVKPDAFDSLFKKYATQYALDWKMVKAISMNETGLGVVNNGLGVLPSIMEGIRNPTNIQGSKSSDGKSWGMMQMTLPTARDFDKSATEEKLNNPEYSIRLSCQFIAWLTLQFNKSDSRFTEWVVKSYNQGRGNTAKEMRGEKKNPDVQAYWERYQRNYSRVERNDYE